MRKMLPAILSVVLLVALFATSISLDQWVDWERMQEVSTIPNYRPSESNDILSTEPADKGGSPAPNFTVTDASGNSLSLDQLRGKPVILNFWASWSGPSVRELALFQQAYNDYKDDVHFVIVNTTSDNRETQETATSVLEDNGYTFPAYFDTDASAANPYKVTSLPTTFFIDAYGRAVAYAAGEITRENLEVGLQACIRSAEKTAAETTQPTEATDATDTTDATETTETTQPTEATKATTPGTPGTDAEPEDDSASTGETLAVDAL